jgi:DNA adenine methylase
LALPTPLKRSQWGDFILSLNDVPEVRATFAGFEMQAVKTTYTIAGKGAQTERGELLIANLPLAGAAP